ncbi:MAG: zinc ribbon domain-containing protein, partial [Pseudomonadota bacterium]
QKFQAHLNDPSQTLPAPPPRPEPDNNDPDVRVHDEGLFEMIWDCEYCSAKKLLAKTHKFCPQCGGPQDTESRYFPPDHEKVAVHDHEYVGADIVCPACEAANPGNAEFCGQCGSPLTDGARAKRQADLVGDGDATDAQFLTEADEIGASENEGGSSKTKFIVIGVIAAIIIGVLVMIFWTKEVSVTLTGHSWAREVKIDDYAARSESAWCDSTPYEAYGVSRSQKVRSHKQIPDGETCTTRRVDQGDGTYKQKRECRTKYRKEPIYDAWCTYRINRWGYDRSAKAQGADLNPAWPQVNLRCSNQKRLGCERESGRIASYYLTLQSAEDGETHQCDVKEQLWRQAQPGSQWSLEVGAVAGGARCGSLEPLR